jgi:predicted site-specific integrase-resolvase
MIFEDKLNTFAPNEEKLNHEETILTVSELCSMLKITRQTANNWCRQGILSPKKLGARRTYFLKSDIFRMLNNNPVRAKIDELKNRANRN